MTKDQQRERISELWDIARKYGNKVRLQARLQKIAELNLREMNIDDIQSGDDEKENETDGHHVEKVKWYLIDIEKPICRAWNAFIVCITIYNLIVTPFILVFPEVY